MPTKGLPDVQFLSALDTGAGPLRLGNAQAAGGPPWDQPTGVDDDGPVRALRVNHGQWPAC